MARPALPLLALVVAVALAGCLGGFTATNTGTPTTDPPTTTPQTTVTYGTDCPYVLYIDSATAEQRNETDTVRQFRDLSEREQELFEQALENGSVESDSLPDLWSSPGLVAYQNETYYAVAAVC
ncbi:hypothetical protein [Haloarchaeobius sp. HME9146]|uniref:hypothetical protein n=1 Tax=Haloarchaeobius sp. HME9146 TaxID=2978732 RepID=UPI0021BF374B|nr:hypothetical protein [Haloarchaeobius sp. HME9146]MCT9094457.1 hypothetical protein [Haloarchaeobius sp. HME9146]